MRECVLQRDDVRDLAGADSFGYRLIDRAVDRIGEMLDLQNAYDVRDSFVPHETRAQDGLLGFEIARA
jgi:hypothetical protein